MFYKIVLVGVINMVFDDRLVNLGKRISKRRKELGLTQEAFAESIGLSLQSVSCIELGKKGVRPENLMKICEKLNISSDYLLFGKSDIAEASVLTSKISTLSREDFELVEKFVNRLADKK